MNALNSLLTHRLKLYEPSPKYTQDPLEHALLLRRNKIAFWFLILLVITHPLLVILGNMPLKLFLIAGFWKISMLFVFLLLCRSYIWWFHLCFTVIVALGPVFLISQNKDFILSYPGISIIMPISVLLLTNNVSLMILTGISQFVTSNLIFKEAFINTILTQDAEFVAQKLIISSTLIGFFIMLLFGYVVRSTIKTTKDLAHANKTAEELFEQQKTFIFSFSHELRNPLNSLLGNLQLILMSAIPDQTRTMVKTSQICAELLLQLVNNILDVGKCDIGNLEVNQSPTVVHDLFHRIWTVSSQLIANKKLQSHIKVEKRVPSMLMLDNHRMSQIMMNLIGNAIKFTDTGSVSVTIKWLESSCVCEEAFEPIPYDDMDEGLFEKEENLYMLSMRNPDYLQQSGGYITINQHSSALSQEYISPMERKRSEGVLKIIIRDTGSGMNQAALNKLFQKFSQVSDDVHKRQIGTGLGLYITKEICKKMNGDIRAYSKLETGSTFIICIPTSSVVNGSSDQLNRSQSMRIQRINQKKLNALVADDSPLNVNMICDFFKKISANVVETASNGLEAYNKYKHSIETGVIIDIVTLDINMPKMNGKMACQKIRDYEKLKGLRPTTIMLISGNYDAEQMKKSLGRSSKGGADCFLRKPILFEEFSLAVYQFKVRQ